MTSSSFPLQAKASKLSLVFWLIENVCINTDVLVWPVRAMGLSCLKEHIMRQEGLSSVCQHSVIYDRKPCLCRDWTGRYLTGAFVPDIAELYYIRSSSLRSSFSSSRTVVRVLRISVPLSMAFGFLFIILRAADILKPRTLTRLCMFRISFMSASLY